MSRVGGKIRVGRVTPIQQFFFLALFLARERENKKQPFGIIVPNVS